MGFAAANARPPSPLVGVTAEDAPKCMAPDATLFSEVLDITSLPTPTEQPSAKPTPAATPTPVATISPVTTPRAFSGQAVLRPTPAPPAPTVAVVEGCRALIALVNEVRRENGLAALTEEPRLDAAAQQYAEFLATNDVLNHSADRRTLQIRAEAAGYTPWIALGENLAGGYSTFEDAVSAWMQSLGHRDNILNPGYTETGVGCAWNENSSYRSFFVQEFGTP